MQFLTFFNLNFFWKRGKSRGDKKIQFLRIDTGSVVAYAVYRMFSAAYASGKHGHTQVYDRKTVL
jgi:hypothetical protein